MIEDFQVPFENVLLICTVGGSPEPLVASIKHWRPKRVLFLPSKETEPFVAEKILPLAQQEGAGVGPGNYEVFPVPDAQSLVACIRGTARQIGDEVRRWLKRGDDFGVVVDFTGGTKCMTGALALQAHQWPCRFSYVGGTERTKDNVGVVVAGKEILLYDQNPWDSLGYQAIEEANLLFDRRFYAVAAAQLEDALPRVSDPTVKRELATLKVLAEAYSAWDRFLHRDARHHLEQAQKNANDLLGIFGTQSGHNLSEIIRGHLAHLIALCEAAVPAQGLVHDLLANAQRRAEEGRYDDAVARLYRAVEAMAQIRLREAHGIADSGKVSVDQLPPALRETWSRKADGGFLQLGLQDAYALLKELGDSLGNIFFTLEWHDRERSPLVGRNQSIFAHGFAPVGEKVFHSLWKGCLQLAAIEEEELPQFPRLGRKD